MKEHDCIFCQIVARKIPANIVEESEHYIIFHDINPVASVHVLIVPKVHVASINELSSEQLPLVADLMMAAQKAAKSLKVSEPGYRLVINTGSQAGQTVNHLHMHLIAGRPLSWPPG